MKKIFPIIFIFFSLYADKEIILEIPKMHCPLCTIIVRKEISKIDGIKKVKVNLNEKSATIKVDDIVNIDQILKNLEKINYPAIIKNKF